MAAPFMWMITTSLKEASQVFAYDKVWWQEWIPTTFVWENYLKVWKVVPFAKFYVNSIFVSILITLGQVATSAMAAITTTAIRPGLFST